MVDIFSRFLVSEKTLHIYRQQKSIFATLFFKIFLIFLKKRFLSIFGGLFVPIALNFIINCFYFIFNSFHVKY